MARSSSKRPAKRSKTGLSAPPLPATKPESVGLSSARLQILTDAMKREADKGTIPGAVVMVARRGKVVHFDAVGTQDPTNNAPMTRDSIFRIMSMTKPVVSIGLMQLVENGLLALNDPVSKFIPEFRDQRVGVERDGQDELAPLAREVTVQDLLRHTSGIVYPDRGEGPAHRAYRKAGVRDRMITNAEFAAKIGRLPLCCQPGSEFNYGFSTDMVGRIIEVVTGKTLGAYLSENILGPLQMTETAFYAQPRDKGRLAQAFGADPWTGQQVTLYDMLEQPKLESGGGGFVSTATDYSRFCQMLLNGGSLGKERIIGERTLRFMTSDHLGASVKINTPVIPPGYSFGLGFAVRLHRGMAPAAGSVGQFYWSGVFGTGFFVDPAEDMFAIMLTQAPGQLQYMNPLFRGMVYAALEK